MCVQIYKWCKQCDDDIYYTNGKYIIENTVEQEKRKQTPAVWCVLQFPLELSGHMRTAGVHVRVVSRILLGEICSSENPEAHITHTRFPGVSEILLSNSRRGASFSLHIVKIYYRKRIIIADE